MSCTEDSNQYGYNLGMFFTICTNYDDYFFCFLLLSMLTDYIVRPQSTNVSYIFGLGTSHVSYIICNFKITDRKWFHVFSLNFIHTNECIRSFNGGKDEAEGDMIIQDLIISFTGLDENFLNNIQLQRCRFWSKLRLQWCISWKSWIVWST